MAIEFFLTHLSPSLVMFNGAWKRARSLNAGQFSFLLCDSGGILRLVKDGCYITYMQQQSTCLFYIRLDRGLGYGANHIVLRIPAIIACTLLFILLLEVESEFSIQMLTFAFTESVGRIYRVDDYIHFSSRRDSKKWSGNAFLPCHFPSFFWSNATSSPSLRLIQVAKKRKKRATNEKEKRKYISMLLLSRKKATKRAPLAKNMQHHYQKKLCRFAVYLYADEESSQRQGDKQSRGKTTHRCRKFINKTYPGLEW